MKNKQISLVILLCGALLTGCGQQEKPGMTAVDQASDYITEPSNHCGSQIFRRTYRS